MFHVNKIVVALMGIPALASAQSFNCFQSTTYNGQYTGIPTQAGYVNALSATTPNTLISQSVPVVKNSLGQSQTLIVCPTANGNYNLSFCSPSGCAVSTTGIAGGTNTSGTSLNFTPSCLQLAPISGSQPNVAYATVDNSATVIKLPYWLDKPCP